MHNIKLQESYLGIAIVMVTYPSCWERRKYLRSPLTCWLLMNFISGIFLGGKKDPGEKHPHETACRELWEETGKLLDLDSLMSTFVVTSEMNKEAETCEYTQEYNASSVLALYWPAGKYVLFLYRIGQPHLDTWLNLPDNFQTRREERMSLNSPKTKSSLTVKSQQPKIDITHEMISLQWVPLSLFLLYGFCYLPQKANSEWSISNPGFRLDQYKKQSHSITSKHVHDNSLTTPIQGLSEAFERFLPGIAINKLSNLGTTLKRTSKRQVEVMNVLQNDVQTTAIICENNISDKTISTENILSFLDVPKPSKTSYLRMPLRTLLANAVFWRALFEHFDITAADVGI